jgi:hypothetical protein
MKHLKPAPSWKAMAALAIAATLTMTAPAKAQAECVKICPEPFIPKTEELLKNLGKALLKSAGSKAADAAVKFALELIGLTGPSEVDEAKAEIIAAINESEANVLEADVGGALTSLSSVLRDPANAMINNPLLALITRDTNHAVAEFQAIISRGNAALAYASAPYLSLAVSVGATASRLSGRPLSDVLALYQPMMDLGMALVGVDITYPQSRAFFETADEKLLWQEANLGGDFGSTSGYHRCSSAAQQADAKAWAPFPPPDACDAKAKWCYLPHAATPPSRAPHCWEETHNLALRAFNYDNNVRHVKMGMLQGYALGLNPTGVPRPYILSRCLSAANRPVVDFDGDCRSDIAVWRNGTWFIRPSSTGSPYSVEFGDPTDNPVLGDFDGDGKTDVALFRPLDGSWWVMPSGPQSDCHVGLWSCHTDRGTTIYSHNSWGTVGDIPVVGDYDGDGVSDVAVWRPSTGRWWLELSSGSTVNVLIGNGTGWGSGASGDIPVPGDYDGDGRTDMAFWRPSTGTWFIISSLTSNTFSIQWGAPGDVPVPGDYDGDGRIDAAVFRPSDNKRYIRPSNGGASYSMPSGIYANDAQSGGDFDGDGKGDVISVNGSSATGDTRYVWKGYLTLTGSTLSQQWGTQSPFGIDYPLGVNGKTSAW